MELVTMDTDLKHCSPSGTESNALRYDQRPRKFDTFLDTHVDPCLDVVESVVVAAMFENCDCFGCLDCEAGHDCCWGRCCFCCYCCYCKDGNLQHLQRRAEETRLASLTGGESHD